VPRHAAAPSERNDHDAGPGLLARTVQTARNYLPRGNTLDDATFARRHLFLSWVLGLHVPALFILGATQGYDMWHVALELTVPVACVAFGRLAINRRLASFFVTAGLVYCSVVLVHLSGGVIESHFHFFILIGLIALYQDWVPFLWNVVFTVLSHGIGSAIAGDIMFVHGQGQNRPWTWAAIHGVAVLAACVGEIIFWQHTEQEQQRNIDLVAEVAEADAARQKAMSELLVNLARRNQSLLNRQLTVITDLELRERQPDVLEDLFRLDHLATRIRRNAESLLVLSGDEPARRWGNPVALGDVVRAAAAEVEDYRRVEVLVNDHIDIEGRAVADLAHLLAELIENATTFSPPSSQVQVRSHLSAADRISTVISVEDAGIGMSDEDLQSSNLLLAEAPEVDLGRSTMLGFHVVARLASRYGISVQLAPTPGGGVTAMVTLPDDLVSNRPMGAPAPAGVVAGADRYQRAAAVARGLGPGYAPESGSTGNGSTGTGWAGSSHAATDVTDAEPPGPIPRRDDNPVRHLPDIQPTVTTNALPAWRELPPAPPPPAPPPPAPPAPAPATPTAPAADPPGGGMPQPPDWWWESESMVGGGDPEPTSRPSPAAPAPATSAEPIAPALPALGDGLVRRVPGAHLAPSLRRGGGTPAPAVAATPPAPATTPVQAPATVVGPAATADPATGGPAARPDRDQIRSMLTRFQNSQRAGRAVVEPTADDAPQENR
jgi:signal transduction histidine kinase